jgi:4-aminobutyrate aminotransferase-like enzyme
VPNSSTLRLLPPLTIGDAEVDEAVTTLRDSIGAR